MLAQHQHIDTDTFVIWACLKFDLIFDPCDPSDLRSKKLIA